MKTYAFCPISENKINERVARLNAIIGVILLLGFAFTQSIFFIIFLSFDFLLRSTEYSKLSLIGISSKNIMSHLAVKPKSINAGPKIFAARIGFALTALIILSFLFSLNGLAFILAAILAAFSFLEGAVGFCVACQIYPYLYKYLYGEG